MQKALFQAGIMLCVLVSLASQASLQVEFNRADAFIKRYPTGLFADELLTLEYTPSKSDNSNAQQQALENNNDTNTGNNNAADSNPTNNLNNLNNNSGEATDANTDNKQTGAQHSFIALLQQERTGNPQGAVIIAHDVGQNVDWPHVIKPSRQFLPDVGWMTLSIAIPKGRIYQQQQFETAIFDRLARAHQYVNERGQLNIAFIGSGTAAYWLTRYLNEKVDTQNNPGFYLISINGRSLDSQPANDFALQLGQLAIPILDLYQPQQEWHRQQAKFRLGEMRRQQRQQYSQLAISTFQADVAAQYQTITRRIWGWLRKNAAGEKATVKDNQPATF